ncbi:MAG: DUF1007 family protein [Alphaproteobacteria bacterium]|nr:DUF1007 family protein [Alphaproteobacteria bacterium]
MRVKCQNNTMFSALCLFIICGLWGRGAAAHPHIFVDAAMTLNFEKEKLISIKQRWEFGEMFSLTLLEDYDTNEDGKYSEKELKILKYEAFDNLAESEYFTHINLNGKKQKLGKITDFSASHKNGLVTYLFTTSLPSPLNIKDLSHINIGLYDPEYYIDIAYSARNKVTFKGIAEEQCFFKIKEDKENPTYYGMVFPRKVYFSCDNF